MDEISDAIEEQQFESAALRIIKESHHHSDGSEPVLTPLQAPHSGIEVKLEEEQRMKGRQLFEEDKKPAKNEVQPVEELQRQPVQKEVAAGCSCGQFLFGKFSDGKNPSNGSFSLRAYSASGSATVTYGVSGSQKEGYSASGSPAKGYQ
ncbi:hypothetical protein HYU12_00245 [Candidatus Woesearchaeota archaeon]|nr:hypothetical protein [Candidatus Woesearchaeota archaeon]